MPKTKDGGFFLDETSTEVPRYPLKRPQKQAEEKENEDCKKGKKPGTNKK